MERGFALVAMAEAEEDAGRSSVEVTSQERPLAPFTNAGGESDGAAATLFNSGYRDLLGEYGWDVGEALLVIYGPTPPNADAPEGCANGESGGNASAYNANNWGLFQVNGVHVDKLYRVTGSRDLSLLFDPAVNVAVAFMIWADQGWAPWACRPG